MPSPYPTSRSRHCLLGVALSLLIVGCSSTHTATQGEAAIERRGEPEADTSFRALPGQAYTPADWPETLEAHVYLPDTSSSTLLRPAALVVHGGGWQNRTPDDMTPIAERLAQEGYVAVNIEHRFAPEYRFPAQLHDLQQAMAWLHDNAHAWRVDTDHIVGVGFSSGAHLVSLLAVAGTEGPLASPYGGDHARLAAVLAGGTPSDLFKFDDGRLVVEFLGGTRAEVPEQYRLASPARQVTTDTPPFFLFHGTWDRLVPVDHATDFKSELAAKGVETELYLQHWRGHVTSFLTRGGAIDAGIAFLNRQVNGQ
ncbi:alpha/beta hydrolase [Halomonas sp. TRM85114]|uniref:alpha/beta hydrolase fold domain-containing protein n=1 Tax=Halomonas jincaotanensis TaxID=2810616 RepID=UPI001BD61FB0|nr:alpha/beta hydrolase [Halomonas jincaotanensis]MBS9402468.1 alpha/beta hydrolase [Halomonas jincaotanensis]